MHSPGTTVRSWRPTAKLRYLRITLDSGRNRTKQCNGGKDKILINAGQNSYSVKERHKQSKAGDITKWRNNLIIDCGSLPSNEPTRLHTRNYCTLIFQQRGGKLRNLLLELRPCSVARVYLVLTHPLPCPRFRGFQFII